MTPARIVGVRFSATETLDIGMDLGAPAVPAYSEKLPFAFTGRINSVEFELAKDQPIEFKLTRGSWETVEKHADGSERPNRTLTPTRDATVDVTVAAWADQVRSPATAPPPAVRTLIWLISVSPLLSVQVALL